LRKSWEEKYIFVKEFRNIRIYSEFFFLRHIIEVLKTRQVLLKNSSPDWGFIEDLASFALSS